MDERMKDNTRIHLEQRSDTQTKRIEKSENNSIKLVYIIQDIEVKSVNNTTMGQQECTWKTGKNKGMNNPTMNRE